MQLPGLRSFVIGCKSMSHAISGAFHQKSGRSHGGHQHTVTFSGESHVGRKSGVCSRQYDMSRPGLRLPSQYFPSFFSAIFLQVLELAHRPKLNFKLFCLVAALSERVVMLE